MSRAWARREWARFAGGCAAGRRPTWVVPRAPACGVAPHLPPPTWAAVEATHLERLAAFALDLDQLRAPLQACARALARELRSPSIVYGPDSSSPFEAALDVVADSSLSEIIAVATRNCGAPARRMRDMVVGDDGMPLDGDGHFIEVVDL